MSDFLTITGLVATQPRHIVTSEGLPITSFRLASTQRRFDRSQEKWIDGETNWYTITAFRQLAIHAAGSIAKGQRVVLSGRLRIRDWENGERTGTTIDIEADSLGHDLAWGTSVFTRSITTSSPKDATATAAASHESSATPTTDPPEAEADVDDRAAVLTDRTRMRSPRQCRCRSDRSARSWAHLSVHGKCRGCAGQLRSRLISGAAPIRGRVDGGSRWQRSAGSRSSHSRPPRAVALAGCVPTEPMPTPTGSTTVRDADPHPDPAAPDVRPHRHGRGELRVLRVPGREDGDDLRHERMAAACIQNLVERRLQQGRHGSHLRIETAIGEQADSVIFSVRFQGECLIGQIFQARHGTATRAPILGTGTCLVGATRPIDF